MALTSPHILYEGTTAYDLREVTSWNVNPDDPDTYLVRFFTGNTSMQVEFDAVVFDAAKQDSLDNGG